jgi:hypothetical protein
MLTSTNKTSIISRTDLKDRTCREISDEMAALFGCRFILCLESAWGEQARICMLCLRLASAGGQPTSLRSIKVDACFLSFRYFASQSVQARVRCRQQAGGRLEEAPNQESNGSRKQTF